MKALVINCTLKKSPEPSNTEALASMVTARLSKLGVRSESVRAVDPPIAPGVVTDAGDGDARPDVHERLLDSEILVNASPTWLGRPSSVAQRVLERSEISGALADIGYTIPGQAWTYWHLGPGPGPDHLDDEPGRDWAHSTGRTMADNPHRVAGALAGPSPVSG
ncbi:NAD(P)H-dependent oxidoreductase [Streptomyces sp. NPDC007851]|uniref:flavodoxin family protein n=1 Tax=Streptomyces sp. NPDC007851 TaxID=3155008 RepID=UPI0033C01C99